ncbi:uncharacterized protein LOC103524116 [Trichonephila clavipes]|uniref:Uncharacterized protein LOC103524116 n=1 Tax=Trichonephila clavipes TaxID=2585209 RepID=A0A8X6UWI8_TRICX|nr:uncharacterized protein LOC103524116 [Trichonephila clavipes]
MAGTGHPSGNASAFLSAGHVSVDKEEVEVFRLLSAAAAEVEMGPGNRDSICVVGFIEVLRKARYLPEWYTTMWKLKELKKMHLAELTACRPRSIGMKQLFDDELPKIRVNEGKKVFFLIETTYKKLITAVQNAKMTTKKAPRAYWMLNSYDVMFGENKRRLAPELECITKREESGNRCSRFSFNQGAPRGGLLRYTPRIKGKIVFQWVPSHCGLWGNERADFFAKKGTGILQNVRRDLTLHSAKLEIKRIFRESFRLTASRVARDKPWSTLCKKSHGIPSSPRAAAVAKFRLLTGHDCLCAHLFRFNLVTSPICVLCDTGQDMTAAHLDECSALIDLNSMCKKVLESPLPNDLMVNGLAFVK